jgi:hypothetical protein
MESERGGVEDKPAVLLLYYTACFLAQMKIKESQ